MADEQFSSNNFYEILGVEPNSSQNEIKRSYQILALKVGCPRMFSHRGLVFSVVSVLKYNVIMFYIMCHTFILCFHLNPPIINEVNLML